MTLVLYGIGVAVYLAVGACLGWRCVKELFVWGRRERVPIHEVRALAHSLFGVWLLIWPVEIAKRVLSRTYDEVLNRAERNSYTRVEKIAHLEKELDRMRRDQSQESVEHGHMQGEQP